MNEELSGIGVSADKLAQLKERHGRVYLGRISYPARGGGQASEVFLYREPHAGEADLFSGAARKPNTANRNLLSAVILAPDRGEVMGRLRDYPLAVQRFVDDELLPFFGLGAEIETQQL